MSQSTPSKRMAPQQDVAATMADTGAEDRLERHLMRQRGAGYVDLVMSGLRVLQLTTGQLANRECKFRLRSRLWRTVIQRSDTCRATTSQTKENDGTRR